LSELRTYIVNNRHVIPNYGERYHNGQAIATGFVESTVNEVVSKRFCKNNTFAKIVTWQGFCRRSIVELSSTTTTTLNLRRSP